ncbi:hypothetical protein T10_2344, partial [Trichinella papuae]
LYRSSVSRLLPCSVDRTSSQVVFTPLDNNEWSLYQDGALAERRCALLPICQLVRKQMLADGRVSPDVRIREVKLPMCVPVDGISCYVMPFSTRFERGGVAAPFEVIEDEVDSGSTVRFEVLTEDESRPLRLKASESDSSGAVAVSRGCDRSPGCKAELSEVNQDERTRVVEYSLYLNERFVLPVENDGSAFGAIPPYLFVWFYQRSPVDGVSCGDGMSVKDMQLQVISGGPQALPGGAKPDGTQVTSLKILASCWGAPCSAWGGEALSYRTQGGVFSCDEKEISDKESSHDNSATARVTSDSQHSMRNR